MSAKSSRASAPNRSLRVVDVDSEDAPTPDKAAKLARHTFTREQRAAGRHCASNLFNELWRPFKRPLAAKDAHRIANEREATIHTGLPEREVFGLAMQFVAQWLPYQCLLRMVMATGTPSFATTIKTTTTTLIVARDELTVRRLRVQAFADGKSSAGASPHSFPAIRKQISAADFPNVTKIIIPYNASSAGKTFLLSHDVPLFDTLMTCIAPFAKLTHLSVPVINGAVHYWKSLPPSLEHLCLVYGSGKSFHKKLTLSHLSHLKSLVLHSSTKHSDDAGRMGEECLPPYLMSLKTKFSWTSGEVRFLPRTLKIFECYRLECDERAQFPPSLVHIGVLSSMFDIQSARHFPPSVTSVMLPDRFAAFLRTPLGPPAMVNLAVFLPMGNNVIVPRVVQAAGLMLHAPPPPESTTSWRRLRLGAPNVSLNDVGETMLSGYPSIVSLDICNLPVRSWVSSLKAMASLKNLRMLSVEVDTQMSSESAAEPQSVGMPPSLTSLTVTLPYDRSTPHSVDDERTEMFRCLKLSDPLRVVRFVSRDKFSRGPRQLRCPNFAHIPTPPSLHEVSFVFSGTPALIRDSATCAVESVRQSMRVLGARNVKTALLFITGSDHVYSVDNSGLRAEVSGDPVLDDFQAAVRRDELVWGW